MGEEENFKKQVLIQLKIDRDFKHEVEEICNQLGIELTKVLRMCLRQMVIQRGIPFPVQLPKEQEFYIKGTREVKNHVQGTESTKTLEIDLSGIINREIAAARKGNKI